MNIFIFLWKKISIILFIGILVLGILLRMHDLYTWPRLGATFDEYAWTWLGMNLIQHHEPISWSRHPQYTHFQDIRYQKTPFRLVTPYLEHPPLFGLVAGSYALFAGAKDMYHVDLQHIRGLALILGAVSILLVFLLARELYGNGTALIASFLYAIIPSVVVGSRLVENENFFIPGFLAAIFFAHKYIKTKKKWFLFTVSMLCGFLVLAKIPWAAATLGVVMLFVFHKKYKAAAIVLSSGLLFLGIFFLYGMHFDAKLFLSLWQLQLNRYDIAFDSVFALFTAPVLTDRNYLDGWIYAGWFAYALLLQDIKKHIWIILPLLAYFAVFVYAIPNEPGHGWYRYPFFPFLVIALSVVLKQIFNKNYFISFFFLLLTGLSMLQQTWTPAFGFSFLLFRLYLGISSLTLLPVFFPKTKSLTTFIAYSMVLFVVATTIIASLSYNEQ